MIITNTQKFWLESDFVLELLKQIPASVFWKDKYSVYLGCNHTFAKSLGLVSPEDVIGKTDYDLPTTKEESDAFRADDKEVIISKQPKLNIEEHQTLPDGRKVILLTNKVPLLDKQGNVIGILGVYNDITAQKINEKLNKENEIARTIAIQEKARAVAENYLRKSTQTFAGGISHNFKTQLKSSLNICNTLIEHLPKVFGLISGDKLIKLKNDIGKRAFECLVSSGKDLYDINCKIKEHIEISLENLNNIGTENKRKLLVCNIYDIIHECKKEFERMEEITADIINWDKKNFDFLGNTIEANIVIYNLLDNAIYQIEKNKKGKICISTESNDKENIICFKDTAGGAPDEVVKTIFDGYNSTKGEKGTGVGLSSCKKIMNKFGGDITCHSVYGDYIEFKLIFPRI